MYTKRTNRKTGKFGMKGDMDFKVQDTNIAVRSDILNAFVYISAVRTDLSKIEKDGLIKVHKNTYISDALIVSEDDTFVVTHGKNIHRGPEVEELKKLVYDNSKQDERLRYLFRNDPLDIVTRKNAITEVKKREFRNFDALFERFEKWCLEKLEKPYVKILEE